MRKFTKSLLALALMVFAVGGAKAESKYEFTSYSLSTLLSENTLFSMVAGDAMICGENSDNQMRLKSVDETLPDFTAAGSYRFRISVADDATLPAGITSLYRIVAYKADGTSIYQGPWGHDGYLTDLGWTYNINSPDGASYFAISEVAEKENTYKISSYFKTGELKTENIFGKSEWILCEISKKASSDPLQDQKDDLEDAIAFANKHNSFAKTSASWNALQDAISDGEAELANASTTAELLVSATNAINTAISNLKLQDGYTNLTKDMYYNWNSATAPTTGTSGAGGCDYVTFASTSQPYGNGGVPLLSFADLSTFDTFYVLATGGTPRILLNRDIDNGQCSDVEENSHLIDNTNANCMKWASGYFTTEGSNVTVDLKQLATNKGFAHLHTIKSSGGNVNVSDMLLYRTITVGAAGNATFGTLYKNAKPNGVKAYAAKVNGKKVELTEVTNVPAGKGVVIEAAEGSYAPTFDVDADDIDTDLLVSNGTVVGDGTIYVLANKNSVPGFYKLANGQTVPAGKAYLKITTPAPEFLPFEGGVTGIETVKAAKANKDIFNLAGQRVAKTAKGLYIVNGKKVVVK